MVEGADGRMDGGSIKLRIDFSGLQWSQPGCTLLRHSPCSALEWTLSVFSPSLSCVANGSWCKLRQCALKPAANHLLLDSMLFFHPEICEFAISVQLYYNIVLYIGSLQIPFSCVLLYFAWRCNSAQVQTVCYRSYENVRLARLKL